MKNNALKKALKFLGALSVTTLVLAGIATVNLVGYKFFHRFDLTAEKSYTVSDATKNILRDLKQKVTIKLFISKNLPTDYQVIAEYVSDIVEEYQKYSGNVSVEHLDPIEKTDLAADAEKLNVQNIQFQVLEKDEYKVQKGYLGLAVVSGDENKDAKEGDASTQKHDSIPFIQDQANLEYELTSMINKLTSDSLPSVGFTAGHEENGINTIPQALIQQLGAQAGISNGDYSTFNQELSKHYTTKTIDLKKPDQLKNLTVVIVGAPKKDFTDAELYNLDQYIINGGRAIFLVDRALVDPSKGLSAIEANAKLSDFISHYGVKINNDLILDKNNEMVSFSSGNSQYLLPYPFWVKIIETGFNKSNPATSKLTTVSIPFVSSVEENKMDGVLVTSLISSSNVSASMPSPFNLDPNQKYDFKELKSHILAMEASGKFKSYFSADKLPKTTADEKLWPNALTESLNDGMVIVMGDGDFLMNNYLQRSPASLALGLNLVDYLGQDESLISIRAKSLTDRVIRKATDYEIFWTRIINAALVPLAVIALGFWRFQRRKKQVIN